MADLIRRVTVERGIDPSGFAMFAFGGCGPTHCTGYGPEIGVRRLIVPAAATVFSAYGISQADLRHSLVQTFSQELRDASGKVGADLAGKLNESFGELLARVHEQLRLDDVKPEVADTAERRLALPEPDPRSHGAPGLGALPLKTGDLEDLVATYGDVYEKRYGAGSSSPSARIDLVNLRVDAVASPRCRRPSSRNRPAPRAPTPA